MASWSPPVLPAALDLAADAPFVGRRRELAVLDDVWDRVLAGHAQAVFVGGEPGIGKTRLVYEAGSVLHREGAATLVGTSGVDFPVPFQPFAEILVQLLGGTEPGALKDVLPDTAGELGRLTPLIARHRPDITTAPDAEHEYRREMFDAYVDLLAALSADRPVVLILEDLHLARTPTLQLLSHVVRTITSSSVLLLATMRTTPPDRSDDLATTLEPMYRRPGVQRIDLEGLEVSEVAQLLSASTTTPPDRLEPTATALRDHTGGNPFFVKEIVRELTTSGTFEAPHGGLATPPEPIRATLGLRVSNLDPEHLEVICLAALLGEQFELSVLRDASESSSDGVREAIERAIALGIVHVDPADPGRYRFEHSLARQAVSDQMPATRRAEGHARIARALEARGLSSPEAVAMLALHYSASASEGHETKAAAYLIRAGDIARRSLAHEDAAAAYERAAAFSPSDHGELLLRSARSLVAAGEFDQARRLFERLSASEDEEVRLRSAIGYEDASWRPGRAGHRAADFLADALAEYAADDADHLYVAARASLGRALAFTGADEAARPIGEEAIELARRSGDQDLLAHALQASLWHGLEPETAQARFDRAAEVTRIAARTRNYDLLGPAAYFRAVIAYLNGQRWELVAAQSDLRRAARTTGQPFFEYIVGCIDASDDYRRGDFAACRAAVESLVSLGDSFGEDDTEGSYGLQMFMIQREVGGLDPVRSLVTGGESWHDHWLPGLLALYTELGMAEPSRRLMRHLLDVESGIDRTVHWPATAAFLVDAIELVGDADAAAQLLPRLERHRGLNLIAGQFVAVFGSADRYLARLYALADDPRADGFFRAALDMDSAMGSMLHQAETLASYSKYLERQRDRVLLDRAREYRGEAVRIATAIGSKRVLRSLEEPIDLPAGLTYREVDVMRLLAEGMSNKEIGARLHISPNTAANHVRSILMKTDSPNRTRAAVFAAQNNLLE